MMNPPVIARHDLIRHDLIPTCIIFWTASGKCLSPRITDSEQDQLDNILEQMLSRPGLKLVPLPQCNIELDNSK